MFIAWMKKPGPTMSAALVGLLLVGCENLPGNSRQQGAAIGGVSGAAAGAAIGGSDHRLLGALLGGAIGAGGGYVIGAQADKVNNRDHKGAQEAVRSAESSPATADQARTAQTADVNGDGFVTMDEVVAMDKAGLNNSDMIERLRATGQVFELTEQQRKYLLDNGVDAQVVNQMEELNREARDRLISDLPSSTSSGRERISQPARTQSVQ